ncbi:mitochondrial protein [Collybia nuda]|uniref:MICOS complex subunit MIC60 n=1 Tax=Collybia nuda TaxID=64659 RepID=A0A9P5XW03_9AGAR|nr:mitochondrial protein [Collybia nuda]
MYRALPVSRRVASTSRQGTVRVIRRRFVTESTPPRKKTSIVRRIFWTTTGLTATFYVGSTFASFYNQAYYDFFSDHIPLGQPMLEYAEAHNWDTLTIQQVIRSGKSAIVTTQRYISDTINRTPGAHDAVEIVKHTAEKKVHEAKAAVTNAFSNPRSSVDPVTTQAKAEPRQEKEKIDENLNKSEAIVAHHTSEVADDLVGLVQRAEIAIQGHTPQSPPETAPFIPKHETQLVSTPEQKEAGATATLKPDSKNIYEAPLPVGFEPPPGFSRPPAPGNKTPGPTEELLPISVTMPLVAPAVSSLNVSEPIIIHLAGTIDNLASYLATNPTAALNATDVLESAKTDLTALADRIEKVREEEHVELEAKLDEQTREYTLKLMELEMEAQDRLDTQEEDFRKFFDEEKVKFVHAYREKLENELKTQTELINERLKEEVIAQGIELQRRWIREIKVRVEQERGGRLSKIDELSSHLKRLERVALDNSAYLDENIRVHAMWSAVRALSSSALSSPVRKPFREELRILRHVTTAREDPVVAATLESLEASDVPDIGIEPFADLASWFVSGVAPKVCHVALVPDENAGVISHITSRLFSGLRFKRQGLVNGDDVLTVLARAEYHLNEKDLDSATRELNQLKGAAKILLHDWLEAARRRLEVQQALEVVQTQATLASLLVA